MKEGISLDVILEYPPDSDTLLPELNCHQYVKNSTTNVEELQISKRTVEKNWPVEVKSLKPLEFFVAREHGKFAHAKQF